MDFGKIDRLEADLCAVLIDRIGGERYFRMRTAGEGKGILAYVKLLEWFSGTTGMGLAEKALQLIRPTPPKKEEYIAEYVDKWLESRQLEIHGEGYQLSGVFKITALKSVMVSKAKAMFDRWEQDDEIKSEKMMTSSLPCCPLK